MSKAVTHADQHWTYAVIYDRLGFCGCGSPDDDLELVLKTLELAPLYENEGWRKVQDLLGPAHEIVLYLLTHADLLEHGGSVGGSWLTDDGKRFLAICRTAEDFEAVMDAGYEGCSDCPGEVIAKIRQTPGGEEEPG